MKIMKQQVSDNPICPQVISPVPQIEQFKIDTSWEFLIVATDGVSVNYSYIYIL